MKPELTQAEVEWLRCLTISRKLMPVLPEEARQKFATARLVETKSGITRLTAKGIQLLSQR